MRMRLLGGWKNTSVIICFFTNTKHLDWMGRICLCVLKKAVSKGRRTFSI
jgi:hypothetical protein